MPAIGCCDEGCECICGICTCGKHPCYKKRKQIVRRITSCEKLGQSEYKTQFPQLPLNVRESFRPVAEYVSSEGPFETKTNYKIDFIPHDLQKRKEREYETYKLPDIPMDHETMYSLNYKGDTITPSKAIKPIHEARCLAPFHGVTIYKEDFGKWSAKQREKSFKPQETWTPPEIKFQGESVQKASYKNIPVEYTMRGCLKTRAPTQASIARSEAPLGTTDYHDTYIPHKLLPKITQSAVEYKPSQAPFDGLTTTKKDYTGEMGPRSENFKLKEEYYAPVVPLLAETTSKADFKPWQVQRPLQYQYDLYCKPEGHMDFNTIYKMNFDEKKAVPSTPYKPFVSRGELAKFDGLTNYASEFQGWTGHRPAIAYSKPEIQLSSAPFDDTTQYKTSFIKYDNVKPTESCKVIQRPQESEGKSCPDTTYKIDYGPKQHSEDCPVNHIDTDSSPFRLSGEVSETGHILVEHDGTMVPVLPPIAA